MQLIDQIHTSNSPDESISSVGQDGWQTCSRIARKHSQPFTDDDFIIARKRRSLDGLISEPETTRSVNATDLLPLQNIRNTKYGNSKNRHSSAMDGINSTRTHSFVHRTFIRPEKCWSCGKKIGFGLHAKRMGQKCQLCHISIHDCCGDKILLPCIPMGGSIKMATAGVISDYAPPTSPMIPAIVIYCVAEVERRGLKTVGIYGISGTEAVVRGLRAKFAKGKGVPCLVTVEIHSVCSFLKDFLRNLQDPLIPQAKWTEFSEAIKSDRPYQKLRELIWELPQANRDTLAYLILHLKNVAASPECKMTIQNLAIVVGPAIVAFGDGNSVDTMKAIMEKLLSLPNRYLNQFLAYPLLSISKTNLDDDLFEMNTLSRKLSRKFSVVFKSGNSNSYSRLYPLDI